MTHAIIKTGGKQYRVSEGTTLKVATLPGDKGASVTFDEVLAISGEKTLLGQPLVKGAKVEGEILLHGRGEKIVVFKFKRRKRYKRKQGHRQNFTEIKITSISA